MPLIAVSGANGTWIVLVNFTCDGTLQMASTSIANSHGPSSDSHPSRSSSGRGYPRGPLTGFGSIESEGGSAMRRSLEGDGIEEESKGSWRQAKRSHVNARVLP